MKLQAFEYKILSASKRLSSNGGTVLSIIATNGEQCLQFEIIQTKIQPVPISSSIIEAIESGQSDYARELSDLYALLYSLNKEEIHRLAHET